MRVGIDVGGTNTDAVLIEDGNVLAWTKSPTTEDISSGIEASLSRVLRDANTDVSDLECVVLGTTQFTNAFVERKHLDEVGVLRIALPSTSSLLPMVGWPDDLISPIGLHNWLVSGGYEADGSEQAAFDPDAVTKAAKEMSKLGLEAIAISSVYAPLNGEMEHLAAEIIKAEIPNARMTLSSDIGRIGLLERENATIMNASLSRFAGSVVDSFLAAFRAQGLAAPLYISQNDGTLMEADKVKHFPILTFASGPTNSMRGAAFLSKLSNAVVVDIGGTTTDVGVILNGYPRESARAVDIGGVRTNFRMPDVLAVGLGGGSVVRTGSENDVEVGPESVGFRIREEAMIFGGDTLTATGIAVANGAKNVGDATKVAELDPEFIRATNKKIHDTIEDAIDRMKTDTQDVPVILVGGGSILVSEKLRGVSQIYVSELSGVANAIGAAIAQVGGESDQVYFYDQQSRQSCIAAAVEDAKEQAVLNRADPDSVKVLDIEELPLAYMSGGAVRLKVKAVGEVQRWEK